jgi:hypothetical protein
MCIISQHLAFEQRFGVVADFIYQAWSLPGASLQEKRTFLKYVHFMQYRYLQYGENMRVSAIV